MGLVADAVARNEQRTVRRYHVAEVVRRETVGSHTVRLTLAAPGLADLSPLGPDEFFALVVPAAGHPVPGTAEVGEDLRDSLLAVPEHRRPDVRWYTVRRHRPEAAEIDVDMVLHGEHGPASRWARHARVGDQVGLREANAAYPPLAPGARQLLLGDETSASALAAILESELLGPGSVVLAEVPGVQAVPALPAPRGDGVRVELLDRGSQAPGRVLLEAVRSLPSDPFDGLGHAWVCGEAGGVRDVRRHLVADRLVDAARITFSGYWRLGRPRE